MSDVSDYYKTWLHKYKSCCRPERRVVMHVIDEDKHGAIILSILNKLIRLSNMTGFIEVGLEDPIPKKRLEDYTFGDLEKRIDNLSKERNRNELHVIVLPFFIEKDVDNIVKSAVQRALSKNLLVITSAGNYGQDLTNNTSCAPANIKGVITACALTRGKTPWEKSNYIRRSSREQPHFVWVPSQIGNIIATSISSCFVAMLSAMTFISSNKLDLASIKNQIYEEFDNAKLLSSQMDFNIRSKDTAGLPEKTHKERFETKTMEREHEEQSNSTNRLPNQVGIEKQSTTKKSTLVWQKTAAWLTSSTTSPKVPSDGNGGFHQCGQSLCNCSSGIFKELPSSDLQSIKNQFKKNLIHYTTPPAIVKIYSISSSQHLARFEAYRQSIIKNRPHLAHRGYARTKGSFDRLRTRSSNFYEMHNWLTKPMLERWLQSMRDRLSYGATSRNYQDIGQNQFVQQVVISGGIPAGNNIEDIERSSIDQYCERWLREYLRTKISKRTGVIHLIDEDNHGKILSYVLKAMLDRLAIQEEIQIKTTGVIEGKSLHYYTFEELEERIEAAIDACRQSPNQLHILLLPFYVENDIDGVLKNVLEEANREGLLVIASAGNYGADLSRNLKCAPANLRSVITCCALTSENTPWQDSNYIRSPISETLRSVWVPSQIGSVVSTSLSAAFLAVFSAVVYLTHNKRNDVKNVKEKIFLEFNSAKLLIMHLTPVQLELLNELRSQSSNQALPPTDSKKRRKTVARGGCQDRKVSRKDSSPSSK
eukprot:TRINITY_DN3553_c0_g1_i1.p1 TRINITY_DN3553_c0_g1~~TRINITY_DN3553_c0_g1_i1.p1  ORF type:complete len:763 (-),score=92.43 TRINITY_DN3553_c0_g1_i1:45-2333(-)